MEVEIELLPASRVCTMCKEDKPKEEYTLRTLPSGKKALQSRCRVCAGIAARESQAKKFPTKDEWNSYVKEYRKTDSGREATLRARLKYNMGLSQEELDKVVAAFEASDGTCDICKENPLERGNAWGLVVDHCHEKLIFRGLLCNQCNTMIGLGRDSPDILRAGAAYVESHNLT